MDDRLLEELSRQIGVGIHDVQDIRPCTARQTWVLDHVDSESESCMARSVYELPTDFDVENFHLAWDVSNRRNEALRTRLLRHENRWFLVLVKSRLEILRWESIDACFDYTWSNRAKSGSSLLGLYLISSKESSSHTHFVLTVYHGLLDLSLVASTLIEVEASYMGQHKTSVRLGCSADTLGMDYHKACQDYWRLQLEGQEVSMLPIPPPVHQSTSRGVYERSISTLWQQENCYDPAQILQLAWSIVIKHYTDSENILYGLSISQKNTVGERKLTDSVIVTFPCVMRVPGDRSIRQCLDDIIAATEVRSKYEDFGLSNISQLGADAMKATQFTNHLTITRNRQLVSKGKVFSRPAHESNLASAVSSLDLNCIVASDTAETVARFDYDQARLAEEDVQRLAWQLEHTLQQIISDTDQSIDDLQLVSLADHEKLAAWNSVLPAVEHVCLHDMILDKCKTFGCRTAISSWDGDLTYQELARCSLQLSGHLWRNHVRYSSPVVLVLEKSKWTVVAVLAVLRLGAICIPTEPSQPTERLQSIIDDTGCAMILASPSHAGRLKGLSRIIVIDQDFIQNIEEGTPTIESKVLPSDVAFIFYTSGSSGKPKGVIMEHRNTATGLRDLNFHMHVLPESRVLHYASYAFDASIHEMMNAFLTSGCLCIPSKDERMDLAAYIRKQRVSWAILTPTTAAELPSTSLTTLKTLITTGETMSRSDVERYASRLYLINAFGPTEAAFCCAIEHVKLANRRSGTIGRVVNGLGWITKPRDPSQLLSIGAVGELLLEGPALARGYLHDPNRTATAFIPAPPWRRHFSGTPSKLYRTGDLVQYQSDGTLRFLGRMDNQVKIRGQRVELGDVEHHIQQSLGGELVVVADVTRPLESKNPIVVAFLAVRTERQQCPSNDAKVLVQMISGLYEKLSGRLPSHMIPTAFIPIERMPRTATGKLDRRQLRRYAESQTISQLTTLQADTDDLTKPHTDMERRVQTLWSLVLGLEASTINANDSFFRRGGDSIGAMRLVGKARSEGLVFTVADVFKAPRLCDFARLVITADVEEEAIASFSLLETSADNDQLKQTIAASCKVETLSVQDAFPCTPLQEGLLAMSIKRPGYYVTRSILELQDHVDVECFQKAWEKVVEDVPILRTRFVELSDYGLVQVILNDQLTWTFGQDLSDYIKQDERISMSLGAPLSRNALIKQYGKCYFVWTIHHAIYDGWTVPVILKRVEAVYMRQEPDVLTPFQDFIKYISSSMVDSERYWLKELRDSEASSFPPLPVNHEPHADCTIKHVMQSITWPRDTDITPSTFLRTAWAILMTRYTDSSDVIFGAIVTGRNAPVAGIERMAGPTIATVPIRIVLEQEKTVNELLQQIQAQAVVMIPFEQVGLQNIRKLGQNTNCEGRLVNVNSHFQTLLVIQPASSLEAQDYGGNLFHASKDRQDADDIDTFNTYALMLECVLESSAVKMRVSFDSKVITQAQGQRLIHQLEHILKQLCSIRSNSPKVKDIETISENDLSNIWTWNSPVPDAVNQTIHALFQGWVLKQPDAPAVCAADGQLTYKQLDDLSTNLAMRLIEAGVPPGMNVPLHFEKSMWMPVAMMAVIKAGSASVAMDISQPAERLQAIIQLAEPVVMLQSKKNPLPSRAAPLLQVPVITVDANLFSQTKLAKHSIVLPDVQSCDRLYVSFTSGTTGTPKGVMISHENVVTAVHYQKETFGLYPNARVYDFASYAFDVASMNCFYGFASGACLCIPSEADRQNNVSASMNRMQVTTAWLTPSTTRLIDPSSVPTLETLVMLGEPIQMEDILTWEPRVQLNNWYGPAETISATVCHVNEHPDRVKNIGRGLGMITWVVSLDGNHLMPIGTIGELWLEGPVVGLGYLNDTDRTQASFIENPPWLVRGASNYLGREGRLYKTGDLVKYNEDGTLDYAGRKDNQVKIRGQRVELGEVEYQIRESLSENNRVAVAVEMLAPKGSPSAALVAFFAIGEEANAGAAEVRGTLLKTTDGLAQKLKDQLPAYMVPAFFVAIDYMQSTPSGKLDRKRLRNLGASMTVSQLSELQPARVAGDVRGPKNEIERSLQDLWAMILKVESSSIKVNDSFLQIGGDSISVMRLVAAARSRGLICTVSDVFSTPRLCDLAEAVEAQSTESADAGDQKVLPFQLLPKHCSKEEARELAAIQCGVAASCIEDIIPCTPLQEGMLAVAAQRPGEFIDRMVLPLAKGTNIASFKSAWEKVLFEAGQVNRSRIIDLKDCGLVQAVLSSKAQWRSGTDLTSYLIEDQKTIMGLGTSLSHYAIIKDDRVDGESTLVWTRHHVIYDGWSTNLFLKQVENVCGGETATLKRSWNAFVKYIKSLDMAEARKYWQQQFNNSESMSYPTLPSSTFRPRADSNLQYCVGSLRWPQDGITASTRISASWALTVAQYTSTDVIFGTTVTGRNANIADIELMPGPTITTIPIRMTISWKHGRTTDFLRRAQAQTTANIQYEQIGLQEIQKVVPHCQFQTLLVVQHIPAVDTVISGGKLFEKADDDKRTSSLAELNSFNPYALMVEVQIEADGVKIRSSFDSHVVEEKQMLRIMKLFEQVLRQLCSEDDQPLNSLRSITESDMQEIWNWNSTIPTEVDSCVHDLIQAQVRQRPNAPAVCAWDGDLTYAEIDESSTRLAHRLLRHDIENTIVPLCFEKSLWVSVAMLGVMKAGGASVVIDVNQPLQRLRSIVDQVQPKLVLTSKASSNLASNLGISARLQVDRETLSLQDHLNGYHVLPHVSGSSLLYVVFTSGSTGVPKGAMITHSNFSSAIIHQQRLIGFGRNARVYDFSSHSFDAVWSNFLHALSSGGCLCVPSESSRNDDVAASMSRFGATYADLTPSTVRLVDPDKVQCLNTLILAGEPISTQDIMTWGSRVILRNTYGPAECSVTATASDQLKPSDKSGNIGRGAAFATWVMDPTSCDTLVPIGALGELYLEGPLVGSGYINEPEKTAASFVEDPDWLLRGAGSGYPGRRGRMYKTGDLVTYNTDGTLNFVSRKDDQVKIRGQRVELGDVEHNIQSSFAGAMSVVADVITPRTEHDRPILVAFVRTLETSMARPLMGGGDHLLFVQPSEIFRKSAMETENRIGDVLPKYMIPAVFIPIRRIPVMGSGKTNRRELREQAAALTRQELLFYSHEMAAKRQPSTDDEHAVRKLWAQVLNIDEESISIDESFFKLGGDSISAMRLSAKSRAAGYQTTVAQIFKLKTIARLALESRGEPAELSAVTMEESEKTPFALSPMQQFFFDTQTGAHNHFYQTFLVRLSQPVIPSSICYALNILIERHSMLRAQFMESPDGEWTQKIRSDANASFRFQEQTSPVLDDAMNFMANNLMNLDIKTGPIFIVNLINTHEPAQYLFLIAHHLVVDLVSWRILLDELEELLVTGSVNQIQTQPFQTWSCLQAQYAEEHLSPEVSLPFDSPDVDVAYWGPQITQNTYADTRQIVVNIDDHTSKLLFGSANDSFRTQPVDLFQAALLYTFKAVFSDRPAPVIFNEGHGREPWNDNVDVSRTVGWFTTMWPTLPPAETGDLLDMVRKIKDRRRGMPRNGWSYFTSRYLHPRGKAAFARHDQVEILFNYEGLYQQLEQKDALFQPEECMETHLSELMKGLNRSAIVDVTASARRGSLKFIFDINRHVRYQDQIDAWTCQFKETLQTIALELATTQMSLTLHDLPHLDLTYETLDELQLQTARLDIAPWDIEDAYTCTSTQEMMLQAQSRHPELYATYLIGALKAGDDIHTMDVPRLKKAWLTLVDRHSALRAHFLAPGPNGVWKQLVTRTTDDTASCITCCPSQAIETLEKLTCPDYENKNITHHMTICQTDSDLVYFRLDVTHVIIDAISRSILFNEWSSLYNGHSLSPEAPSYGNYITELRLEKDTPIEYWMQYLCNLIPCLIPVDHHSTNELGTLKNIPLKLGVEEVSSVRRFQQDHGSTLPTLIKSAWALTLRHFVKQDTVSFGYLDSGRNTSALGVKSMVGALLDTLVCRVDLAPDLQIHTVLSRVQDDYHDAISHPAGALLALGRMGMLPPSQHAFNTLINYRRDEAVEVGEQSCGGFNFEFISGYDGMEFDVVFSIDDAGTDLSMSMDYWSRRLSKETVVQLSSSFLAILSEIVKSAQQRVSECTERAHNSMIS